MSCWGSGLSIWSISVLWKQGVYFLDLSKITDRRGRIWDLGGLYYGIKHQIVLKLRGVSSWGSGLSIWIKIVLWKQGVLFFKAIQNQRQIMYNVSFGELLLFNTTSDCLPTAWVSSWGSELSIWIKIVLWKQGLLFLEPFKITDRTGRIWYLEGLYYRIKHQIVLKLFELHPGVVDCQSELKLFCGNREFPF